MGYGVGPYEMSLLSPVTRHTIRLQKTPEDACPPNSNSSREARSACAKWVCETCFLWCFGSWLGLNTPRRSFAFEIYRRSGRREPYFSEFVKFANSHARPNRTKSANENKRGLLK